MEDIQISCFLRRRQYALEIIGDATAELSDEHDKALAEKIEKILEAQKKYKQRGDINSYLFCGLTGGKILMRNLTMRELLLDQCNWPRKFISPSGEIARLDYVNRHGRRTTGFKPFRRWHRLIHRNAFLPIETVFPIGCQIRFDQRLADNREFIGLIEPSADIFFPFGEWLTTASSLEFSQVFGEGFYFDVFLEDRKWLCSTIVLTFLHNVSVRTSVFD